MIRLKRLAIILLTASMLISPLYAVVTNAEDPVYPGFEDVPEAGWYYAPIKAAYEAGLFSGTGEGRFSPDIPVTRAMTVVVLSKLYGGDISGYVNTAFADVPQESWYEHAVAWAAENGIVAGMDDTHFSPDTLINREQICAILFRCAQKYGAGAYYKYDNLRFDDSDQISPWALDAVELMQMYGAIRERSGNMFAPKATVSRAEVCNMIVYFSGDHEHYAKDTTVRVMGLRFGRDEISLEEGETLTLKPIFTPLDASVKDLTYRTSNAEVAYVTEEGKILTGMPGNAEITATAIDGGYKAVCRVEVTPKPVERIVQINGVTYVDGILIANKTYSLPSTYYPGGLTYETEVAFNKLCTAAAKEGLNFYCVSGFRSYAYQRTLYNRYVSQDGKAAADRYSARPGHSEHQTGLALDVNSVNQNFAYTKEGRWLAANCYKYGFIIRYPQGKEAVTGYMYEPWHIRYLGVDIATDVFNSGLCLEEYLGITS
ncbi:MAG: D-alanyl-D-alanine carboxypeptidase family protein, partial [Clostridia bacterium]|nr:D-alanyl-D-alanine carboxypeptidase family protein [Clostridia bacterium]